MPGRTIQPANQNLPKSMAAPNAPDELTNKNGETGRRKHENLTDDIANGQTAYLILQCNPPVKLPILLVFVLVATSFFLAFDFQNAVYCGYCCGGWAGSLL
ncbi:MAG: hypothetical protein AAF600_15810 [Bacteroidota bacterium]